MQSFLLDFDFPSMRNMLSINTNASLMINIVIGLIYLKLCLKTTKQKRFGVC